MVVCDHQPCKTAARLARWTGSSGLVLVGKVETVGVGAVRRRARQRLFPAHPGGRTGSSRWHTTPSLSHSTTRNHARQPSHPVHPPRSHPPGLQLAHHPQAPHLRLHSRILSLHPVRHQNAERPLRPACTRGHAAGSISTSQERAASAGGLAATARHGQARAAVGAAGNTSSCRRRSLSGISGCVMPSFSACTMRGAVGRPWRSMLMRCSWSHMTLQGGHEAAGRWAGRSDMPRRQAGGGKRCRSGLPPP